MRNIVPPSLRKLSLLRSNLHLFGAQPFCTTPSPFLLAREVDHRTPAVHPIDCARSVDRKLAKTRQASRIDQDCVRRTTPQAAARQALRSIPAVPAPLS